MKPLYSSKFYNCITLLFFTLLFSSNLNAQIRFVEVDPIDDTATIQNFGASTIDIGDYWICTLFVYTQLNSFTVDSGSLNLTSGATVTISGLNLRDSDADIDLYTSRSFGSSTAIVDFIQWGDSGNGRESVANTANIWQTGDFLTGSGPFVYNGNGNQNGLAFWGSGTLSINDEAFSSTISVYPNPVKDILNIKSLERVELENIAIFDTTGRMVRLYNNDLITNTVDLKSVQSGLYTLRLTDSEGRTTVRKIIKK